MILKCVQVCVCKPLAVWVRSRMAVFPFHLDPIFFKQDMASEDTNVCHMTEDVTLLLFYPCQEVNIPLSVLQNVTPLWPFQISFPTFSNLSLLEKLYPNPFSLVDGGIFQKWLSKVNTGGWGNFCISAKQEENYEGFIL